MHPSELPAEAIREDATAIVNEREKQKRSENKRWGGKGDEREKQLRAAGAKPLLPGNFARKKKNKVRPGGKLTQLEFAWKSRVGVQL